MRRATHACNREISRMVLRGEMLARASLRQGVELTRRGMNRMCWSERSWNAGRDHRGMLVSEEATGLDAYNLKQMTVERR